MIGTLRDRTQERVAESDRLNLQNQLQQATKMEALGAARRRHRPRFQQHSGQYHWLRGVGDDRP